MVDGTRIEIKSDVYTIMNGEASVVTDAQGFNNWLCEWGLQTNKNDT